jgi:predicted dehydrogenase
MENVGLALVGAGNIAQNIHLPLLAKMPNVRLLALCDKNLSKAKMIAERYGIPHVCRSVE